MQATLLLIVWFPVAALAYKCCAPDQFTGKIGQVIGTVPPTGEANVVETVMTFVYDATKQRLYVDETVTNKGTKTRVQLLQFYGQGGAQYTIIPSVQSCTKQSLAGDFPLGCLPDNATESGTHYHGLGTDRNTFKAYRVTMGSDVVALVEMTDKCIPLREDLYGTIKGNKMVLTNTYYDMTLGVDPSVFNIPDICKNAAVVGHVDTSGQPKGILGR